MNLHILTGHAGKDPEVRHLDTTVTARLSLATSEVRKDKDGNRVTITDWHTVVFWGKLAEVVEKYVKKGSQLAVEGKVRTRSYDKDGVKVYVTETIADSMEMLGSKPTGTEPTPGSTAESTQAAGSDEGLDLPF
jgi:single-strand DNA-binding protein